MSGYLEGPRLLDVDDPQDQHLTCFRSPDGDLGVLARGSRSPRTADLRLSPTDARTLAAWIAKTFPQEQL